MSFMGVIDQLKSKKIDLLSLADNGSSLFSLEKVKENPSFYARAFSEGDKQLETFLLNCFEKDIYVRACCKGHIGSNKEKQNSFVTFDGLDKNNNQIKAIINAIYPNKGITISFGSVLNVKTNNLNTSNCIVIRFNKKQNKKLYKLMSTSIDQCALSDSLQLPEELQYLYNICFKNDSFNIVPDAKITLSKDGQYQLSFANALSYLKKDYNEECFSNIFTNAEYEERLRFNKFLIDIGFSGTIFNYVFSSNSKTEIIEKLKRIYAGMNNDLTNKQISVDNIVFFVNQLTLYYSTYYGVNVDTYISYENNFITLSTVINDEQTITPIYSNTLLYDEKIEQNLCFKMIKSINNNYGIQKMKLLSETDNVNVEYNGNNLFINTPSLITSCDIIHNYAKVKKL